MSRWKASGIHLFISIVTACAVLGLMFAVWYPPPFFYASGAVKLEFLLVSVDMTLGPLLTLIIFKQGKRGLKFDIAVIATIQAMALVYGMSVVLRTRPVFLVGAIDRFVLVSASDISSDDLARGSESVFRSRSWTGPRLVAVQMPSDPTVRSQILSSSLAGKDIERLPKYYVSYSTNTLALLAHAKPLEQLRVGSPEVQHALDEWLVHNHRSRSNTVWLPVTAQFADMTALLDKHTGRWLGAITIDPW